MTKCKYKITVSSPAMLTGVTADLNNEPVIMKSSPGRTKFESDEVSRESDQENQIELDVHVRGRQHAGVTIQLTNVTQNVDIFEEEGVIGEQDGVVKTRYEINDKKINSKC